MLGSVRGVGRSTTVWHLSAEYALQGRKVRVEDLYQAKHLTNVVQRRGLQIPGVAIAEDGPADIVLLDTAARGGCRARYRLTPPR